MIVVVMGVSGCGKTAVGSALAQALEIAFLDGDDFHPAANVEKMRAGAPLTDDDRAPWLDRLAMEIAAIADRGDDAVLACSALKRSYRDRLVSRVPAGTVRFVHLAGDVATVSARLAARQHRYMPATLLESQFATLEAPADAIVVDIRGEIADEVAAIRAALAVAGTPRADLSANQRRELQRP